MFSWGKPKTRILLVCTANICRSPMAEGVFRAHLSTLGLSRKFKVDSAGTHASQPGHPPDPRAVKVLASHGIDIRRLRARQVREKDFLDSDHILALDDRHLAWLRGKSPEFCRSKIDIITSHSGPPEGIPDPYFASANSFIEVHEQIDQAVSRWLEAVIL